MAKRSLDRAKAKKKDEFYTQLSDIENELRHYRDHFRGKVVYCNCDDPRVSNFFHYFSLNFHQLGLKKLITTCYKNQQMDMFSRNDTEKAIWLEYDGTENANEIPSLEDIGINHLEGNGDFRSAECIELLKRADIVVTNPPFSLFREYVAQLVEYDNQPQGGKRAFPAIPQVSKPLPHFGGGVWGGGPRGHRVWGGGFGSEGSLVHPARS